MAVARFWAAGRRVKVCLTMIEPLKTVAVLIANPALSSILSMTLAGVPSLRVRAFESEVALRSYLQVAGADLVVADFEGLPALTERLREDAKQLQIVALASELSAGAKAESALAGIDEIIMKPMSPRYLVERVLARLAQPRMPERRKGLHRRDWSSFGSNVVPLH
jgi:DNA-binding response OmpR family regulator